MTTHSLQLQYRKIKEIIDATAAATKGDIELQAHWARYVCILTSGFLENSIKEIVGNYVDSQVSKPVADYVKRNMTTLRNPKADKFVEVTASFKPDEKDAFQSFVDSSFRKEAIDNIMKNRHKIAHGRDSNITLSTIEDWLETSTQVVRYMEKTLR